MRMRHVAGRLQWPVTVPSGSMTMGHRATAARRQWRGPPVSHRYGPSDATAPHRIEDRMQCGRRQDPADPRHWRHHWRLLAVVPYSVGFTYPEATCQALGAHCSYLNLSYKTLGQVPFSWGRKNRKGSRKAGLSKNTTQFSRWRRVLRRGGLNHINHRVHHVHTERTTRIAKGLPRKRTTAGRSGSGSGGSVVKPLRHRGTMTTPKNLSSAMVLRTTWESLVYNL
jgi:hypothetical protein